MGTFGKGYSKTKVRVKGQRPPRASSSNAKPTKAQAAMAKRPRVAADY